MASAFEKALQGFSIGDLPYADVQTYLKRLLSSGVSAEELLKVLRRHELVEPLPEYARLDISRVLIERTAAPAAQQPLAAEPDPAPAENAASGHAPGAPAANGALDELLALRELLAAREETIEELAGAIDDRDARSASMQAEIKRALAELAARAASHDQLEAALASERERADALAAELARLRLALESEKRGRAAVDKALAEHSALQGVIESANAEARRESDQHRAELEELRGALESRNAALESRNAALDQVLRSLNERTDQLAAAQSNHAEAAAALEERAQALSRLQADLQASRAHGMALEADLAAMRRDTRTTEQSKVSDLKASQDAVALLNQKNAQLESELKAAKSQAADLRAQLQEGDRLIERLQIAAQRKPPRTTLTELAPAPAPVSVSAPAADAVTAQARPVPLSARPEPLLAKPEPVLAKPEPVQAKPVPVDEFAALRIPPAAMLRTGALFGRDRKWTIYGAAAALVALTLVVWSLVRQKPAQVTAPAPVAAVAAAPGSIIHDCPLCPALTVLPAGRFKQGSARPDRAAQSEKPLHWVSIAHPFAMTTNPVTVDNFAAFIAATHRDMKGCDTYDGQWRHRAEADWQHPGFVQTGDHPVTCVSWSDAKAYADWLSAKTGMHYRLPSASEWEYAARTGGEAAQPWNSDGSGACAHANVADKSVARRFPRLATFTCDDGYVFTAPVGSFKASGFGLNDILGNVFQWTEDCWVADYAHAPIDGSARTSADCAEHELRGGSWSSNPSFVRADARNHFAANYRASSFGIRLVRDVN